MEAEKIRDLNALGKIPVLTSDELGPLYDSPVICEYIDSLAPEYKLYGNSLQERFIVKRWEALADGITDAAYNSAMERRRPEQEQSPSSLERWFTEIEAALNQVECHIDELGPAIRLSHLALASTLGYLDFRLNELAWREGRPATEAWFKTFCQRPSFKETIPIE